MRMLFIGNSYTSRNDLPALIVELAHAGATTGCIETQMIVAGGASLRRHWNGGVAAAALANRRWNYVVLQEQSTLPLKNRARYHDNVRLFDSAIRAAGAETVLYLTWARANASSTQEAIASAVLEIAEEIGARVVPAGLAWAAARRDCPDIELYLHDGSHPTAAGSYLAACVFVRALFGANARMLPVPQRLELPLDHATRLRAVVAELEPIMAPRPAIRS